MKVKAALLKEWCNQYITPVAWQRIIIKALPLLKSKGYSLTDVESPKADVFFDEATYSALNAIALELYQIDIPLSHLTVR
ncbi:MAG: hypothetical protein ACFB0B_19770 [Thermonemataceae bacterium]